MTKEAISTERALKLALEALKRMKRYGDTFAYRSYEQNPHEQVCEAITALEALAEQQEPGRNHYEDGDVFERIAAMKRRTAEQEPVAWLEILRNNKTSSDEVIGAFLRGHAEHLTGEAFVITSPPTLSLAQRQSRSDVKPLTQEEIVAKALHLSGLGPSPDVIQFARAIEAAHGIKENT